MQHLPRFLHLIDWKRALLALSIAIAVLSIQADRRVSGQDLPVVSLLSVEPSSVVNEGDQIVVTLGIEPPVQAGDGNLTHGRLLGGIRVWDSCEGEFVHELIAFAFHPGEETDVLRYSVRVAADIPCDVDVVANRIICVDVNSLFEEYRVRGSSKVTLRVRDIGRHVAASATPAAVPVLVVAAAAAPAASAASAAPAAPAASAASATSATSATHKYAHTNPDAYPYAHSPAYEYAHANSDAYSHTYSDSYSHSHSDAHANPGAYRYSYSYPYAYSHPYPYAHADPDSNRYPYDYTHSHSDAHADPDSNRYPYGYAHSHSDAHANTNSHKQAKTNGHPNRHPNRGNLSNSHRWTSRHIQRRRRAGCHYSRAGAV